jgi:hypothetical protein
MPRRRHSAGTTFGTKPHMPPVVSPPIFAAAACQCSFLLLTPHPHARPARTLHSALSRQDRGQPHHALQQSMITFFAHATDTRHTDSEHCLQLLTLIMTRWYIHTHYHTQNMNTICNQPVSNPHNVHICLFQARLGAWRAASEHDGRALLLARVLGFHPVQRRERGRAEP